MTIERIAVWPGIAKGIYLSLRKQNYISFRALSAQQVAGKQQQESKD